MWSRICSWQEKLDTTFRSNCVLRVERTVSTCVMSLPMDTQSASPYTCPHACDMHVTTTTRTTFFPLVLAMAFLNTSRGLSSPAHPALQVQLPGATTPIPQSTSHVPELTIVNDYWSSLGSVQCFIVLSVVDIRTRRHVCQLVQGSARVCKELPKK